MKNKIVILVICILVIICGIAIRMLKIKSLQEQQIACENEQYTAYMESLKGMKVTMLGGSNMQDKGNVNSCGFVIRTKNERLILVDGGRDIDAELVLDYIMKYGNGTVDYWYITHAHEDHVGALIKLLKEENIQIENLYYSLNTDEWYKEYDKRGYEAEHAMLEELNNPKIKNKISCQKNQIIEMDNVKCEIIRLANPEVIHSDNGNDSSMVFKLTATDVNKSIIFLGDAYVYASKELLEISDQLKADAVQMAHHGQNGVTKEVYEVIDPDVCFFNAPKWLYNNDNGGGYDSGVWQSVIVRGWLEEMGTENYKAFEGDQTIKFGINGLEKIDN